MENEKYSENMVASHDNAFEKPIISWEAPEYIKHEKGWKWFFVAAIVLVGIAVYGAYTDNWTLVVALIVFAAVYYWQHFLHPEHVQIVVSRAGIKVKDKEYPYQNIKSFWVLYQPPYVKTLNLRSNSKFLPDVAIQLGDQDPGELREYLASQIHELEGKTESFSDVLIRIFKL